MEDSIKPVEQDEWVILALRHESGPDGAPFYRPNHGGYVMYLSGAGLYTQQQAESEVRGCGKGELQAFHFTDPELRKYLERWGGLRAAEFDLFHEVRQLRAKQKQSFGPPVPDFTQPAPAQLKQWAERFTQAWPEDHAQGMGTFNEACCRAELADKVVPLLVKALTVPPEGHEGAANAGVPASALYWLNAAKTTPDEAAICLHNAYNHTAGELIATKQQLAMAHIDPPLELDNLPSDLAEAIKALEGFTCCLQVRALPSTATLAEIKEAAAADARYSLSMIDDQENAAKRLQRLIM